MTKQTMTRYPRLHVASSLLGTRQHCRLCSLLLVNTENTDGFYFEPGAWVRETRRAAGGTELKIASSNCTDPACCEPRGMIGPRMTGFERSLFQGDAQEEVKP